MDPAVVKIKLRPGAAEISVDGHRVEHIVSGLTVCADAGDGLPEVVFALAVADVDVDMLAVVGVDDPTYAALRRLGWVPDDAPEDA